MADEQLRQNSSKKRLAMVLALVATIGLVVCATMFYVSQSTKKEVSSAVETEAVTADPATKAEATADSGAVPSTEIFIDHAQIQVEEAPRKATTRRSSLRSSSRNKIASRFPAPPVVAAPHGTGHESEVEMWAGDKRSYISVPPGTKWED